MRRKRKYNPYKKKKSVFTSRLFCFFLIILLAGAIHVCFKKFEEWRWAEETLTTQEGKIVQEEGKKRRLKDMLDYFLSEGYLIRTIKEKLNLVSPGEKVIFVVPEEEEEDASQDKESKNSGFLEGILRRIEEVFSR